MEVASQPSVAAVQAVAPNPTPSPATAPPHTRATPFVHADDAPSKDSNFAVMGVGSFVGHAILFSIPIIGWIMCLIMAFAVGNFNKRNFARAMLIFLIIGIVLSVALYFLFGWVTDVLLEYVGQYAEGLDGLGSLNELFDN
jgi:uncharacterized membrane protein YccC